MRGCMRLYLFVCAFLSLSLSLSHSFLIISISFSVFIIISSALSDIHFLVVCFPVFRLLIRRPSASLSLSFLSQGFVGFLFETLVCLSTLVSWLDFSLQPHPPSSLSLCLFINSHLYIYLVSLSIYLFTLIRQL